MAWDYRCIGWWVRNGNGHIKKTSDVKKERCPKCNKLRGILIWSYDDYWTQWICENCCKVFDKFDERKKNDNLVKKDKVDRV